MCVVYLRPSFSFIFLWSSCCVANMFAWISSAEAEVRVVVPASLEAMEGNSWNARLPTPADGFRVQNLIEASNFANVPEDHQLIASLSWRPDRDVTSNNVFLDESIEIRLSTTNVTPDTLSLTFADNIGDDETVVLSGPIRLETDGSGPPEGPRPFDYVFHFTQPFSYIPSPGSNLLVEMRFSPTSLTQGIVNADGHEPNSTAVWALDESALVATTRTVDLPVKQFTFIPEPTGHVLMLTALFGVTTCIRKLNSKR